MTTAEIIEAVKGMLMPLLEGTDMFVVSVKVRPTANIKVYLDADSGLSVEKSAMVNRRLRALIDEAGFFPEGDFSLEVSSPGVDEPLASSRQYQKNIGRTVEVTPHEGAAVIGVLKEVTDEALTVEVKVPKSKEIKTEVVPLEAIKQTVVQIVF